MTDGTSRPRAGGRDGSAAADDSGGAPAEFVDQPHAADADVGADATVAGAGDTEGDTGNDAGADLVAGDPDTAAATGDEGTAAVTTGAGDKHTAATTGDEGTAAVTGDKGAAATTGDEGTAAVTGSKGAAAVTADKGATAVTDDLEAAADAVEVDLELLLAEREQYLDAYRRAQADFENYRKQAQKRQDDAVVRSLGSFVEGLLPVLDSCDAALAHGASEVEPVLAALYGALSKEGLERIDPKGSAFDPEEAEAVVHEPGEGGEQMVAEVLRPGYRWRGRVLRPAMVKVTD
jgi:molecular chaperone GrpE